MNLKFEMDYNFCIPTYHVNVHSATGGDHAQDAASL